jgi:hypothetical protein
MRTDAVEVLDEVAATRVNVGEADLAAAGHGSAERLPGRHGLVVSLDGPAEPPPSPACSTTRNRTHERCSMTLSAIREDRPGLDRGSRPRRCGSEQVRS